MNFSPFNKSNTTETRRSEFVNSGELGTTRFEPTGSTCPVRDLDYLGVDNEPGHTVP